MKPIGIGSRPTFAGQAQRAEFLPISRCAYTGLNAIPPLPHLTASHGKRRYPLRPLRPRTSRARRISLALRSRSRAASRDARYKARYLAKAVGSSAFCSSGAFGFMTRSNAFNPG